MPTQPTIEVQDVEVVRGGVSILRDVNLEVTAGTLLGVLGPNGGGKSTLLRLLVGLETADRGTIRVLGLPPGKSREVGYLPQAPSFDFRFPATVRDVVSLGLSGRSSKKRCDRIDSVLEPLGLASLAGRPAGVLSGGQRQRMFLARALVRDPRLLLLDEPTLGVDAEALDRFLHLLVALREKHELTVIMVSHDFSVITTHADQVVCLAGTVHYLGSPAELDEARLTETFGVHNLFLEHHH